MAYLSILIEQMTNLSSLVPRLTRWTSDIAIGGSSPISQVVKFI